jgi:hypothetical protein
LSSKDDLNIVVADVLDKLARPDNADQLLVVDNINQDYEQDSATDSYDVRQYLPGDHGSVLITTWLSQLVQIGELKLLKKGRVQYRPAMWCP